jgi:hypothetical protein
MQVLEYQITQPSDLDVNVTRDDNGANDIVLGLGLIDFVGDRLTIDMDSLAVLNGQFAGTAIDIDFAGGKDIDLGAIIGVVIPSPLDILNDQVSWPAPRQRHAAARPTLHSSSDIVDDDVDATNDPFDAASAIVTVNGDLTIRSDSTVSFDAGTTLNASNISLVGDSTGAPLVKGIRANATGEVTLNGAALTATGGTVTLTALGKVDMTGDKAEDGDTFFGNALAGTLVTSFSTATVNIVGTTTINAATLNVAATVDADIEASVKDGTVKILSVLAAGDARVSIGDANGTTTINVTGDLTAEAKSDVKIDAKSQPGNANDASSMQRS